MDPHLDPPNADRSNPDQPPAEQSPPAGEQPAGQPTTQPLADPPPTRSPWPAPGQPSPEQPSTRPASGTSPVQDSEEPPQAPGQPGQGSAGWQAPGQPPAASAGGQAAGQGNGWQAPGGGDLQQPTPWQAPGQPVPQQPAPYGEGPPQYGQPGAPPQYGQPGPAPYGQPGVPAHYGQPGGPPQYGQPGPPPYGQPGVPGPYAGYPQYGVPYQPVKRPLEVAPAGTPYHRLARTPRHRWWRPLVGTLVLAGFAIAATLIVVTVWGIAHAAITGEFAEPEGPNSFFGNSTEDLAVSLLMLAILTPFVLLTVRLIQRRPPLSVFSVVLKIRWRWMLLCCLPGFLYLVANVALGAAFEALFPNVDTGPDVAEEGTFVGWAKFVVPALVILLLVPFQSAAEEFVFRGWLVQAVGAYGPDNTDGKPFVQTFKRLFRSPWPALVVSSVAFVFGHGYTGWAMADVFLFAMTVGWLTIRTGGLESGIALHTVNNVIAFMLPAAVGDLDSWADQGGAPWPVFVLDIPAIALYAVTVLWLAKRQRIARVS